MINNCVDQEELVISSKNKRRGISKWEIDEQEEVKFTRNKEKM
jgi:hypothetical protein